MTLRILGLDVFTIISLLADDGGEFVRLLRAGIPSPFDSQDLDVLRNL